MKPEDFEGVVSDVDLYPSDREAINRVVTALSASIGQQRNLGAFETEVAERFAEIGFRVETTLWDAEVEGQPCVIPQVSIVDRITPEVLHDHDRHAHQVQSAEGLTKTKVSMSGTGGSAFYQSKSGLLLPGSR